MASSSSCCRPPFVLGHDVAGVVVAIGSNVSRFKVGDEIFARLRDHRVGKFAIQLAKHLGATVATTTSEKNVALVKRLGADVVIDYKRQNFESVLSGYDLVLNSQDSKALDKSAHVLKPGGRLISISGPPDPAFAKVIRASWFLQQVMRLVSHRIRARAKRLDIRYSFLFMRASGAQLREIGRLIDAGIIRPVVDRVFPFEATNEAVAHVETGRATGRVVSALN